MSTKTETDTARCEYCGGTAERCERAPAQGAIKCCPDCTHRAAPWPVKPMTGFKFSHAYIVVNPACPEGRHPTRGGACGCKTFRTVAEAEAYAGGEGR